MLLRRPEPPPWLLGPPARPPAPPPRVDLHALHLEAIEGEARGVQPGPAIAYVRQFGPTLQADKWGAPLPLSTPEQDRLDRMVAILSDPARRGLELVFSGTLDPGEADAIRTVYPDVYAQLVAHARADMATTPPPWSLWAELTLSVLFGQPVAKVYGDHDGPAKPPGPQKSKPGEKDDSTNPTPADRREVAVRQEKG